MDKNELWNSAKTLAELRKAALIEIGSLYLQLESAAKIYRELKRNIEQKRISLLQVDESLKKITEALIKSYGISDGNVTLDFDKKEIANESIPTDISS